MTSHVLQELLIDTRYQKTRNKRKDAHKWRLQQLINKKPKYQGKTWKPVTIIHLWKRWVLTIEEQTVLGEGLEFAVASK